jgi:nitrogen fixation NifU-like protein
MDEIYSLYSEMVRDHSHHPHNFGPLPEADKQADGHNPLCGDRVVVHLISEHDRIQAITFTAPTVVKAANCALATASASMMTDIVRGKSFAEAETIANDFIQFMTSDPDQEPDEEKLGKLASLAAWRMKPLRTKCATLPWHTLKAALHGEDQPVSTE